MKVPKRTRITQKTRIFTDKILIHNLQSSCFQQNKNLRYPRNLRSKDFLDSLAGEMDFYSQKDNRKK